MLHKIFRERKTFPPLKHFPNTANVSNVNFAGYSLNVIYCNSREPPKWNTWNLEGRESKNHYFLQALPGKEHPNQNHLEGRRSSLSFITPPYVWVWCICKSAVVGLCVQCWQQAVCMCLRGKVCTPRVVRVNKRRAAGTHVALLSELREKTNCFFTPVWFIPPSVASPPPPRSFDDPPQHKHAISAPQPQIQHMDPIRGLFLALLVFIKEFQSVQLWLFSVLTWKCEVPRPGFINWPPSRVTEAGNSCATLAQSSGACHLIAIVSRLLHDRGDFCAQLLQESQFSPESCTLMSLWKRSPQNKVWFGNHRSTKKKKKDLTYTCSI